jgi:hypothetical protein
MLGFIATVLFLGFLNQISDPNATVIEKAKADLAARLQISPETIEVLNADPVNWPDSCLGVYHAGQVCIAVVTPGSRLLLRAAGRDYPYNASQTDVVYAGP